LSNGANPDAMSEIDFELVMVAFGDGIIGNKKILNTLGSLTTGVFNYMRSSNSPSYTLNNILGSSYDYIYKPLTNEEKQNQANQNLLAFISMAPGAKENLNG
jgi:hypothetical protein